MCSVQRGDGWRAGDRAIVVYLFYSSQKRSLITTLEPPSILPAPLPGFPAPSVQPRVWNSIQEQAWQTLFFISMETRACNKTRTPCLKCQNSLTHFSPFLQKQNKLVWVLRELIEKPELLLSLWTFWRGTNSDNLWKHRWCYRTTVRSQTRIVSTKGLIGCTKSTLCPCPNLLEEDVHIPSEIYLLTREPIPGMQTWGTVSSTSSCIAFSLTLV